MSESDVTDEQLVAAKAQQDQVVAHIDHLVDEYCDYLSQPCGVCDTGPGDPCRHEPYAALMHVAEHAGGSVKYSVTGLMTLVATAVAMLHGAQNYVGDDDHTVGRTVLNESA